MNKIFLIFLVAFFIILPAIALSQAPDTAWVKTFNFGNDNEGWSVRETSDGGLILAGSGMPNGFGDWDILLIKTDANGNLDWTHNFGGLYSDEGRAVRQTPDGGFIFTGWTRTGATAGKSIMLIKTDASGQMEWSRTYSDYDEQEIRSIELTSDGGYIMAGWAKIPFSEDSTYEDALIMKTDSLGNEVWRKHYGGSNSQKAWSIINTFDGGFFVAGWSDIFPMGSENYILKLNQNGDSLWLRTFGYLYNDGATSVLELPNHNIVVGGSLADEYDENHAILAFPSQNGDTLNVGFWPQYRQINSMSLTNDTCLIITGLDTSVNSSSFIAKVHLNGSTVWTKSFEDYPFAFSARSIIQTSDGGYVFTGTTRSYPENIVLVKLAPEHAQNVKNDNTILPQMVYLSKNYPNPFNSSTLLKYRLSEKGPVTLSIYNLLGQKVATLVDGIQIAGEHQALWNSGSISSGVYFARLTVGGNSRSMKLILMK